MEKKKHLALRLTERPLRLNGVGIKLRLGSKPDAAVAADESAGSSDSIPSKMRYRFLFLPVEKICLEHSKTRIKC